MFTDNVRVMYGENYTFLLFLLGLLTYVYLRWDSERCRHVYRTRDEMPSRPIMFCVETYVLTHGSLSNYVNSKCTFIR